MPPRSRSSPNRVVSRIGLPSYLNLSRRLLRWMKQIHLPRTHLRMRYVRLVHAYHVLDGSCSHISLIDAMATLLVGWVAVDEGDNLSSYCVRLREECVQCTAVPLVLRRGTYTKCRVHTHGTHLRVPLRGAEMT